MKLWEVKRGIRRYKVHAETRSKAKYAAYKLYSYNRKSPMSFHDFFIRIDKVSHID